MEPRMRSSFPTQKNGRPSPGSLIRLLCSAFLSPLFVLAAVTSHQFSTAPAGETAVLYAVVLDAGSTGTGVFVYNVVHEEDKCHGGLGRVTVQVPALASGSVRPGISAFAKGQENGHSRGHAAFPDELLEEKQREAFFTPEAHDLGEQHDILLEQHLSHLKSGSRTQEEDDEEKHANTRLPSLVNSGLSELVDAEEGVEMYLQRLRVVVDKIVQTEEQKQRTFVFFRGTAGMRVLSEDQRESLLEEIRAALSTWGFQLPEGSMGATVLEGSEEGVLSWLALNQLLGNFDGDNRLIVVEPRHLLRQKTKWNSKSPAERETNEALKGEIEAGSMAADEREGGKKPQEKKRVGLIEMGSTSAQVVIHIPSGLRPSSVYTPLASKVDLVPEASGSTRRSKTFFPPIRSHSAASFPGSPVQDFVEVDLCTERHFLYAKSYFGFGRQRGVLEHIHETVQDALEERKTAIREGRAAPPTRENPFEVSISCVPSDVRVHVRPSHLLQKASTDSAVPLSLHDDGDWGGNAEWKRETLDDARQKGRNKIFHPAGVPKTDESSETLSWRMRPDRGAGLMKSIERIAVQGASDAAACKERVAVRVNRAPAFPFKIHPDIPLFATKNFHIFNKLVLLAEDEHPLSGARLAQEAARLCKIRQVEDVVKEIHTRAGRETAQTACFSLTLMSQFLTRVLRLESDREIMTVHEINGIETSWTAAVPMLYLAHAINERKQRESVSDSNMPPSGGGSVYGTSAEEALPSLNHAQNKEGRNSDVGREEL